MLQNILPLNGKLKIVKIVFEHFSPYSFFHMRFEVHLNSIMTKVTFLLERTHLFQIFHSLLFSQFETWTCLIFQNEKIFPCLKLCFFIFFIIGKPIVFSLDQDLDTTHSLRDTKGWDKSLVPGRIQTLDLLITRLYNCVATTVIKWWNVFSSTSSPESGFDTPAVYKCSRTFIGSGAEMWHRIVCL